MEQSIATPHVEADTLRRSGPSTGARREFDPDMQGISRDERPRRPSDAGWRVRLFKGGQYVANRHFRDAAYQGVAAALAAAKRFRDDMAIEHDVRRRTGQGNELSRLRVAADLAQSTLASWMHVSTPLIARWERVGAPDAVIRLVTAMIAGVVQPTQTVSSPDLLDIRLKLDMRQEDMAAKFDRGYNAYGEWERNKRPVPGWVKVYLDAVARGWDEQGVDFEPQKAEHPSDQAKVETSDMDVTAV
jgi:DNA-binding transcriptional regulator YiaG